MPTLNILKISLNLLKEVVVSAFAAACDHIQGSRLAMMILTSLSSFPSDELLTAIVVSSMGVGIILNVTEGQAQVIEAFKELPS